MYVPWGCLLIKGSGEARRPGAFRTAVYVICPSQMKRGELEFIRQMNELEVQKAKELGEIEACDCSSPCVCREMWGAPCLEWCD